jgi:hypothetical protein
VASGEDSNKNLKTVIRVEPHGQSPAFGGVPKKRPAGGRTSRTRGPIHPRVEPVVLLVQDRKDQYE